MVYGIEEQTKNVPVFGRRASSTGGFGPRFDDQTNWRVNMQEGRIKFDDARKKVFLEHFGKTNRLLESATVAGVSRATVKKHYDNDPNFAEGYNNAQQQYADSLHAFAEDLIYNGVEKPVIGGKNKDTILATTIEYPIPLLQMELKRLNPDYKDRQVVENTGTGAVILIPAHMDAEQWIAEQQAKNQKRIEPAEEGVSLQLNQNLNES